MATYNSITPQPAGHITTSGEWASMTKVLTNALEMYSARKTADESVVSSTTPQTDDELFVAVVANAVYDVHAMIMSDGNGSAVNGIKSGFSFPALATMPWGIMGNTAGSLTSMTTAAFANPSSGSVFASATTAGGQIIHFLTGTLVTGANAGTLAVVWCQNSSLATATTVKAGSKLMATRIA